MERTEKLKLYGRIYTRFNQKGARISISDYSISIFSSGKIELVYKLYGRGDGYTSRITLILSLPDKGVKLANFLKENSDIIKGIIETIKQKRRLAVLSKLIFLVVISLYGLKITKSLKAVYYYHEENELYYRVSLSSNAFLKGIYRKREYFETLLGTLGLFWPRA